MFTSPTVHLVNALTAAGYWPGTADLVTRTHPGDRVILLEVIPHLDHRATLALLWVAVALSLYRE